MPSAFSFSITSTAAAPSVIWLELPAVMTPSGLKAGFSEPSFSIDVSARMPSSVAMLSREPSSWRDLDGHDLVVEPAVAGRGRGLLVRAERELVELARATASTCRR